MSIANSLGPLRHQPTTLVDFKRLFDIPDIEFCLYETYEKASQVPFSNDGVMFCNMLQGSKHIQHKSDQPLRFLPHQTLILAPDQKIVIDFPQANAQQPTTCATIEVERSLVQRTVEQCQQQLRGSQLVEVNLLEFDCQHSVHGQATEMLWQGIKQLFLQRKQAREVRMRLAIDNLVKQTYLRRYRQQFLGFIQQQPHYNGFTAAVLWMQENLELAFDITQLCTISCMSRSRLFFEFDQYLGCSPSEFLQQLRLSKAAEALASDSSITDICFDLGYQNPSHFSRRFKAMFGYTPRQYRKNIRQAVN